MEIKDIEYLAELSKLQFNEQEMSEFSNEFNSLIELVDVVKNTSVDGYKNYQYSTMGYLVAGGISKLFTDNEISVNPVKKVERINLTAEGVVDRLQAEKENKKAD